jgi:hypothetical protein
VATVKSYRLRSADAMEHLWSGADATNGNRWQTRPP